MKPLFELLNEIQTPTSPDSLASIDLSADYELGRITISKDTQGMFHCLFQTNQKIIPRKISRGFSIRSRNLIEPNNSQTVSFLDLCWSNPFELRVFASVIEELRETKLRELDLTSQIMAIIKKWDYLLSGQERIMTAQEIVGLFGELCIFKMFLIEFPEIASPSIWTGPLGNPHDFELPSLSMEVKTTSKDFMKVNISSLHQLDTIEDKPLFLTSIRVQVDESGQTLDDLREDLARENPNLAQDIETRMELVGYTRSRPEITSFRLKIAELKIYHVKHNFPKLTKYILGKTLQYPEIEEVNYVLDLSNLDHIGHRMQDLKVRL